MNECFKTDFITKATHLVLEENTFRFDNKTYRQLNGMAMETISGELFQIPPPDMEGDDGVGAATAGVAKSAVVIIMAIVIEGSSVIAVTDVIGDGSAAISVAVVAVIVVIIGDSTATAAINLKERNLIHPCPTKKGDADDPTASVNSKPCEIRKTGMWTLNEVDIGETPTSV
ncbi:Hypothetical predicted protein [Octopus vulgaris]|uniref:Uncharacterized protein n=1 Tax=Octopus vulgaris TaxID=6645 RepID=A0AA36B757_OCTVU|nr:Hypothetical predicted protein [Octopus vulgaris]